MSLSIRSCLTAIAVSVAAAGGGHARAADDSSFELYGFAMIDYIQDFNRVNPDWEDTLRASRIPTDPQQFGDDGQAMLSVKQSRLGVRGLVDTAMGKLTTRFQFDMFGVGADASAGPPSLATTPLQSPSSDPVMNIDAGQFRAVPNFPGAQSDEKYPDLTSHFRTTGDWGHVQVAGILRWVGTEVLCNLGQTDPKAIDYGANGRTHVLYDDHGLGWGVDLSTVLNLVGKDALRAGVVYGEGIASYMNDGGMDTGPNRPPGTGMTQIEAVPLLGLSAYYDQYDFSVLL